MAYQPLPLTTDNRVKVSTLPAVIDVISGSITTTQPSRDVDVAGGTVVADVSTASNITIFNSGTFSGINCTFEGSIAASGADNWFAVQGVRTNSNTIELTTGALSAQPAYAWEFSVNALSRFRVRATARTSGTQVWSMKLGSYATEPIPAIQSHAITGTVATSLGSTTIAASASVTGLAWYYNGSLSNTDVTVKASAGRVYGYDFYNPNTTAVYVQFFNALIANVTPGSTSPTFSLYLPPQTGRDMMRTVPLSFATAITICATTTATGGIAPTLPIEARVDYL